MKISYNADRTEFLISELPDGSKTEILDVDDVDIESGVTQQKFAVTSDGKVFELVEFHGVEIEDNIDLAALDAELDQEEEDEEDGDGGELGTV